MHKVLADARFYATLLKIDRDLARGVQDASCQAEPGARGVQDASCQAEPGARGVQDASSPCGGPLHAANYPRRPHGGPPDLPEGYEKRLSFCCGVEGCRTRTTPASVRFFGRRWYLAPVVVLVSALQHGANGRRMAALRKWLGERVCRRTVERWRSWWLETFPASPHWTATRGRFVPPVAAKQLPLSLLERFLEGDEREQLTAALSFLGPVTTSSGPSSTGALGRR